MSGSFLGNAVELNLDALQAGEIAGRGSVGAGGNRGCVGSTA